MEWIFIAMLIIVSICLSARNSYLVDRLEEETERADGYSELWYNKSLENRELQQRLSSIEK